ncbi:Vacuolar morphogenesis protein 6 [Colletotrichum tanaceti]|uniref:Vacuolar morphogenesis protein 6 n=1 Tax=Colletotrichum tanaceti TaxID=1306861 RepID=A0A4V6DHJ9_9PEZI|nr:Vacuolar morphogenesis protein 6 [Colletotrichum tanaceti]KAJ0168345.1 Vacuolar morphogenesis protein 6 [Colletotrichum tanaceti]TKW56856.1 Vacuolar morphogenesis protein 6 [Colletotrichum tanaceti]
MLSAFTARPIIELKPGVKSKIETILAHGDRVFVGLNNGVLRIYRVNELPPPSPTKANGSQLTATSPPKATDDPRPAQQPKKPTDLLREIEKFSNRAIDQLAVIKEANTLVSLSNYYISLHDLGTYEPLETLSRTKNATCFAVTSNIVKDAATGIPEIISRLAVAVRRRLLLWSWHESELGTDVGEVTLPESIRTVTWASATKVVCGMNSGYVMVDVVTHDVEDINSPGPAASGGQASRFGAVGSASMGYMGLGGYMPKPLAAKLAEGELLLAKDINSMFITDEGRPVEKRQIPWQSAPEQIGYSYPYILALQPPSKGSLEVRNPDTLHLLQTIPLPGAAQLHFPPPNLSLAHAGKGFHISSDRCVWKMGATDYDAQIDELVEKSKFDEAISILNMLEDALLQNKKETLREVKMLKAETLFKQKRFYDSMDLFNEDDVHAPPERVLKFFPPSIAGEMSGWAHSAQPEDSGSDEKEGEEEHHEKANGEKSAKEDTTATPTSPAKGGVGFAKLFMGHRKPVQSDTASIMSKKNTIDVEETGSSRNRPGDNQPLEGDDLRDAVRSLAGYLVGTRTRLQRVIDPSTGKLKRSDTNGSTEEAMKSFMSGPHVEESSSQLEGEIRRTSRIVDTALFRSYMMTSPSLAGPLFRLPNFCDPDVVNEALLAHSRYNELVDFFSGKKLHSQALELLKRFGTAEEPDEAAPGLHGPQRTVTYLQTLPPSEIDLILQYSEWVLRADPKVAMEVFIADSENAETLPRARVARFLGGIDPSLEVQYLEHIITELDESTPDFHNRLVELFIKQLKDKKRNDDWDAAMDRFVQFLKTSSQYSLIKAFSLIPRDDPAFYEAQAIVLSSMGSHKQALEIYVFKMKNYAKAEEYCNQVHKSKDSRPSSSDRSRRPSSAGDADDASPSIYHTLLSLYLTPPPPHKPAHDPALELLSRHGSRLPAASTLSLIPDDLPVRDLESYFRGRIRSANSVVNESRIVARLRDTELVSTQALLLLGDSIPGGQGGRNRRVVITEERLCGVCHKRLGGSVVSVLPDNNVVHYACLNKASSQRPHSSRAGSWARRFS